MQYGDLMTVGMINDEQDIKDKDVDQHIQSAQCMIRRGEQSFCFGALALKLTDVLDQIGAPKEIQFFSLDVEGNELNVLRGLDLEKYKIKNLIIEARQLDRVQDYLQARGFVLYKKISFHDYIFKSG
jgi:hypothetical protein